MKKTACMIALAGAAVLPFASQANAEKPVALWLCSDYVSLDESYRPVAVGFAAAVNHDGKVEEAVLDTAGIAKLQPQLLQVCNENPQIALRDALVQAQGKTAN